MQATRNAAFQLVPVTLLLFAGCSSWESFRLGQPLRPAPGTHPQQAESRSTPIELSGATAGAAAAAASSTTPTTPSASLEERIKEYVSRYPATDTPAETTQDRRAEAAAPAVTAPENAIQPARTASAEPPPITAEPDSPAPAVEAPAPPAPATSRREPVDVAPVAATPAPTPVADDASGSGPPKLESVDVRPANSAIALGAMPKRDPPPSTATAAPANQPLAGTTTEDGPSLQPMIDAVKQTLVERPDDLAQQVKLRLLYLLAGQDDDALAPAEGISNELAALLSSLMRTVATAQATASDQNAATDEALRAIDQFRDVLRTHAELEIPRVALCRRVDSFGVFDEITTRRFPGGEATPVILYCEVSNFATESADGTQFRTLLTQRLEVLTQQGELVWEVDATEIEDLSFNRREDFFLAQIVQLPATLAPGDYVLNVTIEDKIGAKSNQRKVDFTVTAGK